LLANPKTPRKLKDIIPMEPQTLPMPQKNNACEPNHALGRVRIPTMKVLSPNTASVILAAAVWSNSCFAQFPGLPSLPVPGWGSGAANAAAAAAVAGLVVYIIERHEASERQKQIAEERARRAYANMSSKRKAQLKAKKVRYIAVDTEKNAKTSPQAKKSVMVWDTDKQQIANGNVYDVQKSPPVGQTAKFDRYSAEYVGSGS
jgi:hypothetical protein